MELFHTPDTMPDAPNKGSNTRSKPAGLGNQVRELLEQGLLPLFDEDLLPTPTSGRTGTGHPDRRRELNPKHSPELTELARHGFLPVDTAPDGELLPTPTTGYSGREPGKWRAERKPSNVGNERKITDLQVAMVELDGGLPVLPTPSAVDGSGGSMIQSLDALREGRRQKHLTDLPRMLELEFESLPLLRTPQAQVTEPKPGIKLEGRTPSDPQVGLADQVLADFHGPLLPTPVVNDMGAGKTPEQWDEWIDSLKARGYGNGNGHGNSLSVEVIRAEGEALLPTPQTRDATGGKPEAVNRGRGYGADLNDVAAAGLLDQAPPLLPTPCAVDRLADGNMTLGQWDESRRSQKERGVGSFGPRGDSLGAAVLRVHEGTVDERPDFSTTRARTAPEPLLPTPMSRDHQTGKRYALDPSHRFGPNLNDVATAGALGTDPVLPTPMARDHRSPSPAEALRNSPGLSSIGALLPTPAARDSTGGQPSRLDRSQGAFLNDVAAAGLLPAAEPEKVKLLPTPTTLDHVEKRTTHAGGNPTLQGAVCGTNPVDAERLGVRAEDPLLPTPAAWDTGGGRQHTTRATGNGKVLSEALREIPLLPTPTMRDVSGGRQHTERGTTNGIGLAEALREIPLMPTPQATDHMCGSTTLQGRIDSNRQVMLPHVVRDLPLLPTPTRSDGSGGGVRTNLTWEGTTRSTGDGGNSRLRDVVGLFGLDEALPMLPTPRSADHKGTDSASERNRNTPGLGAISIYYDTSLDDAQDGGTDLMPTPQARDWKGAPGRNYKNRNLARDMERLAAGRDAPAAAEPEPETVVNQHGDEQFVLFPTPNVGARNVRNSPGEMARRTPALGAVVADLVESTDPLLPTPQSADQLTGAPMTDRPSRRDRQVDLSTALTREMVANDIPLLPTPNVGAREVRNSPGEMARLHPALGAVVADLAEMGDASRFHGSPLLPTPVVTDSCGTRNSTAWRSDPESKAKIGDTLTDAMWKLAAERGEMVLPDGPSQARFTDTALLPTPVARDCNGHIQAPTADVGNNGRSVSLGDVLSRLPEGEGTLPVLPTPNTINRSSRRAMLGIADPEGNRKHWTGPGLEQVLEMLGGSLPREFDTVEEIPGSYREDLLPTPMTVNRTSRRAQTGRPTSGPSRGGPSYGLEDVVTDLDGPVFPTPNAADGDRGGSDPARLRDRGHMVKLIDAVLDGELQQKETLMPTPKSRQRGDCPSERERDSPDLAATTLHFPAGRWGKYGPAVERWEKLTRPAPAPTEPNKNGNPRLTARFSEWLLGWPEGWVTDPEIGIARTGQLRLIGNGVVPQQAATALVMLLRDEAEERKQATYGG